MIQYIKTKAAKELEDTLGINLSPRRADKGSAGWDLSAAISEPVTLWQDEVIKFPTGLCIWIGDMQEVVPEDTLMQFAGLYLPRSSNPGMVLQNTVGLLDSSYQNESFLKYKNVSDSPIIINPGDRIGQLIIIPIYIGDFMEVATFENTTDRFGGFGSTGQ